MHSRNSSHKIKHRKNPGVQKGVSFLFFVNVKRKAVQEYGYCLFWRFFCGAVSPGMDALPGSRVGERAGRSGTGKIFKRVAGEKIEKVEKN